MARKKILLLFICTCFNEVKRDNSCIAVGCTNHAKPGSGISFHAFPHKNSQLLQKCIQAVEKKKNWYQKYTLSGHFEQSYMLSDQEKLGAYFMTIQFQQFSLPFLHNTKMNRGTENCQKKGVCFTTKVM